MMMEQKNLNLENIFDSTVAEVIERSSLEEKLSKKQELVIKLGVDPTSPDLHLGHAVVLRKLRQFQELGHKAVLVIGDFTAKIGDPSGRNTTRPVLTDDEIKANMKTYVEQAKIILDENKTRTVFNSEWLNKKGWAELLKIASQVSVNTLLEREDFANRLKNKESLGLHELLYPVSQAVDSVELKADVELGGWDQRLNLLMGRELQRKMGQAPQDLVILKPLLGLDGERKMSKSLDNYIGLAESPDQIFGKVMSIPDKLIAHYADLAASMNAEEVKQLEKTHAREAKAAVARRVVALYHGEEVAQAAEDRFNQTFRDRQVSGELTQDVTIKNVDELTLLEAVKHAASVSGSEAARLITQNGVRLNGEVVTDPNAVINVQNQNYKLQVGKHRFYELTKEG